MPVLIRSVDKTPSITCWLVPIRANSKSCGHVQCERASLLGQLFPPSFANTHFSVLGVRTLYSVFPGLHSMALTPLICCGPYHNPGMTSTSSQNGLSGLPHRHSTATCLAYTALLNHGRGRFHNPFTPLSFMALKPEPLPETAKFDNLLQMAPGPSLNYICISVPLQLLLRQRKSLKRFPFTNCRISWAGRQLALRATTPFIPFNIRFVFPHTPQFRHLIST